MKIKEEQDKAQKLQEKVEKEKEEESNPKADDSISNPLAEYFAN